MTIQRTDIDFAPQSREYRAKQLNAQVCKNWYGHADPTAAFKRVLFPFPGGELWSNDTTPSNTVRGMYSLNGHLYAVVGYEFRIYNATGEWNVKGLLKSGIGPVKFMANDNQIFVTDFYHAAYIYQLVTTSSRTADTFYPITNASSFIGNPNFSGLGKNDLDALGTYVGDVNAIYIVVIDGQSISTITAPVFIGTGLNDMTVFGTYTGPIGRNLVVQIDGTGSPNTFKWSINNGISWVATGVSCSTSAIDLQEGIKIKFGALTGHTLLDRWTFTVYAAGDQDTFKYSNDNGVTWISENVIITGLDQAIGNGVLINFGSTSGHTKGDKWTIQLTIDDAFFPPITPFYLDGYGIYIKSNVKRIYISSNEDFSAIDALDFASPNAFPDNVVCGDVINAEIYFICQFTTEIWYDAGTSPFPLLRRPNILFNWGTSAPYSLATASNNCMFWLAQNKNGGKVVVMLQNYQIQIISDKALNDKLQEYTYVDDAIGMIVEWTGKIFYFLTIPSADVTWVFDFDSASWRQRSSVRYLSPAMSQDYVEGRYMASCHIYHNNQHYIGDYQSGKIYRLSSTNYMDGTNPMINEAISAPVHIKQNRLSILSLQPIFEPATALPTGQGSDPLVCLQYSPDGGYTWSKEMYATMGKIGEYAGRCKFNKVGYGRNIVFKIRNSDPVYKVLKGAILEFEDTGS